MTLSLTDFGTELRSTTLSSGLRLMVFERPGAPITLRLLFLGGSRFDVDGKEGTAHLLEHMLLAGSKKFPSKDLLAAQVEQYGGTFGATTSPDALTININAGDPADFKNILEILHEMVLNPLFDSGTLETERRSVINELRDRASNPGVKIWDIVKGLVFQGTPIASVTGGLEDAVNSIKRDELLSFFNRVATSGRAILTVSGGVTLEQIIEGVERLLPLPNTPPLSFDSLPTIRKEVIDIEHYAKSKQEHIAIAFRTTPYHHQNSVVLDIIAQALGGGRASVLAKELRYQRGLVYGVGSWQRGFADAGMFVIKTSTEKAKLQEVYNLITDTITRVCNTGLTDREIQLAKDKIIKSKRLELQSSSAWLDFHAYPQLISLKPWTLVDYLKAVSEVSSDDIRRVANLYLQPKDVYIAICGDTDKDSIKI